MNDYCWLPELELYDDYPSWSEYQDVLYSIFRKDFIEGHPDFRGKRVNIRRHPMEYGKEEAFFHITCQDYRKNGSRVPDFRRCERIRWVRAFIENYHCCSNLCEACDGVKIWEEPRHGRIRVHMLLPERRYMVVLEPRESYCLLITAFYIEHDHELAKKLRHYERYRSQ